ncbi:MAG: DUF1552 domain-containing protein [Planctomycetota bacterium]
MPIRSARRRFFLKATGVSIALPTFESLAAPATCRADAAPQPDALPRRLVCIGNEFGMYPGAFWATDPNADQLDTPLLDPLKPHRGSVSVFRHLDHGLKGGHFAVHAFLTGIKASEARTRPDAGISLDQLAAEHVGSRTRFPSLTIGSEGGLHGGCRMSWTRSGTRVPPVPGPRALFQKLFISGDAKAIERARDQIQLQNSILDAVTDEAKSLSGNLNRSDQQKLDEYFSSVRDVERKLELDKHWQSVPKPEAPMPLPRDQGLTRDLPKLYDLIVIALQTDSTRVATLEVGGSFAAKDLGINRGYHSLSHHGKRQENIDLLVQIERYQVEQYARFLAKLDETKAGEGTDQSLLRQTMVLFGSGMGNANSHTNSDLPIVLAGGGFRHGQFLRLPDQSSQRIPLCNLYVSMLRQFGANVDGFGNSTGTLPGLETA